MAMDPFRHDHAHREFPETVPPPNRIADGSVLNPTGYARLLVNGAWAMAGSAALNPNGDPYRVLVLVAGPNVEGSLSLGDNTVVHALVYALKNPVEFSGHADFQGSLLAREVHTTSWASLTRWVDATPPGVEFTAPTELCHDTGTITLEAQATDAEAGLYRCFDLYAFGNGKR